MRRRDFLRTMAASACLPLAAHRLDAAETPRQKGRIAITLDLEMSRHYPRRGMTEWDYKKGELDAATKQYAVEAARVAKDRGARIHFFCVGRVLEHPDVSWLQEIAEAGHPVGNHTYDHVNVHAKTPEQTQFRFQRAPWLIAGKSVQEVIRENIAMTTAAMQERLRIEPSGFRTPGGFHDGLQGREDLQRMLLELGFTWVSSKYPVHDYGEAAREPSTEVLDSIVAAQARSQPFSYPSGLIEIPMSPISDVGAFRSQHWKLDWFLRATRLSAEWAIANGGVFDFLGHPSCLVVEDPDFATIELLCDLVKTAGDQARMVTLDQLAQGT